MPIEQSTRFVCAGCGTVVERAGTDTGLPRRWFHAEDDIFDHPFCVGSYLESQAAAAAASREAAFEVAAGHDEPGLPIR